MLPPTVPSDELLARCCGELAPDRTLELLGPLRAHMQATPAGADCTKDDRWYGMAFRDVSAEEVKTLIDEAERHGFEIRIGLRYLTLRKHGGVK